MTSNLGRWWRLATCSAGLAILGLTAPPLLATRPRPTFLLARLVVDEVIRWGSTAGGVAAAFAVLAGLLHLLERRRLRRLARLSDVVNRALHLPGTAQVRKALWWRGQPVRVVLRHPPGTVDDKAVTALATGLQVAYGWRFNCKWKPRKDEVRIRRTGRALLTPEVTQDERLAPAIQSVVKTFRTVMPGEVTVDEARSSMNGDQVGEVVLRYPPTTRDIADNFLNRVATVLDRKCPSPTGYWTLRWNPQKHEVTLRPAAPLPERAPYPLNRPPRQAGDPLSIPLGVLAGGQERCWVVDSKVPHVLVVGPTGSGKTVVFMTLAMGFLNAGVRVSVIDPKELSFRGLRGTPGVDVVATRDAAMEETLRRFHRKMRKRYEQLESFAVAERNLPWEVLIIDEVGELIERLNAYHNGPDKPLDVLARLLDEGVPHDEAAKLAERECKGTRNPVLQLIWSMLRLARQARIILVLGTQRPDVTFIPGEARANVTGRVAVGQLDRHGLEMTFGTATVRQKVHRRTVADDGEVHMEVVSGRQTVVLGGRHETVQGYWTPDPAKLRTDELDDDDRELVTSLLEQIARNRAELAVDPVDPVDPASADTGTGTDAADQSDVAGGGRFLSAADETPTDLEDPTTEEFDTVGDVDASELEEGQTVLFEVGYVPTPVLITDVEPDYDGDEDDLLVSYQVIGPDGEPGPTESCTVHPGDRFPLLAEFQEA